MGTALTGLVLRLFFVVYFPAISDDSHVYANLATNWLQHGVYGQSGGQGSGGEPSKILPTDERLPGYPAFLAAVFWIFGAGNFKAVLLAQVLLDLGTCLLLADLARRKISPRAAMISLALSVCCPFLASYAAAVLSETLEVFFTALALDCAVAGLQAMREGRPRDLTLWVFTGAAIGACILLRPDGGILLAAVALYLAMAAAKAAFGAERGAASFPRRRNGSSVSAGALVMAGVVVALFALAPLVPWTVRNFRAFHYFQPLAPRYATDAGEVVPRGFNRWVKTWMIDYVSVEELYWNVPGDKIDARKLPARAFVNPAQQAATIDVIADYNESQDLTPDLDARFNQLAAEGIRAHPVRYYLGLPLLRLADMWMRPRTELLPADPRWWEFNDNATGSAAAIGLGLLNLGYVGAAVLALLRKSSGMRWAGLLVCFVLLRSAFLLTLENPEPRYTLECYPAIIVLASGFLATAFNPARNAS